jgi:hypothetical protein
METNNDDHCGDQEMQEKPDSTTDTRKSVTELIEKQGAWTMLPEEWVTHARQKNIY